MKTCLFLFSLVALILVVQAKFRDQKDKVRLETCVGGCLSKYPGVKEFITKYSFSISGMQTLFIGDHPKLTVYHEDESVRDVHDISDWTAQEIYDFVLSDEVGCWDIKKQKKQQN